MTHYFDLLIEGGWGEQLLSGVWLTVRLALATLPFGFALGLLLAKTQEGRGLTAKSAGLVVTVFRALPELLTIFIVYYGGQLALRKLLPWLGVTMTVEIDAFVAGMVALTLVFAAYSSEVFRSAMHAITKGQHEAAHALGLTPFTKYVKVIFPQIWRVALPGLGNLWLVLLKDTSLVSVIALPDLMRQTSLAVSATREPFFFYLLAFLVYLVLSMISGGGLNRLEVIANRPYRMVAK